jgi:V/A-type H+/Na+-transporting ATPase subunit I
MPWRETVEPVRMQRVALVAPQEQLRRVLVALADAGVMEVERVSDAAETAPDEAERRLQRLLAGQASQQAPQQAPQQVPQPVLVPDEPDLDAVERLLPPHRAAALLAGEADLRGVSGDAVRRGSVAALTGWVPARELPDASERLSRLGAGLVPLPTPRGTDPPTLLHSRGQVGRSFEPLVRTYATVPYADIDPTVVAGLAYVFMFGMMFADAGHGLLLVGLGLLLRAGRIRVAARFRHVWPFVVGAGLMSVVFGVLFGEFFGPTGVLEPLWLDPLEEPITLLGAAIGVGAVLLAGAYGIGTANRWREHGWQAALVAQSGVAGVALFLGLGLVAWGVAAGVTALLASGAVVGVAGVALTYVGLFAASGGGGAGAAQATVEVFDAVIRLGTSLVSFARLAAFGLAHAALTAMVWQGTTALAGQGPLGWLAGVALFVAGNTVIFGFEALIAGIQALRLEYYELFSRVFEGEGRPFQPWHVPTARDVPALEV